MQSCQNRIFAYKTLQFYYHKVAVFCTNLLLLYKMRHLPHCRISYTAFSGSNYVKESVCWHLTIFCLYSAYFCSLRVGQLKKKQKNLLTGLINYRKLTRVHNL